MALAGGGDSQGREEQVGGWVWWDGWGSECGLFPFASFSQ